MKAIGYIVLAAAACASLLFVQALMPASLGATAFFSAWLALPYAALASMVFFATKASTVTTHVVVSVLVAAAGLLFLTEVIFLHPDPQGGIAVLLLPVYQGCGIIVLLAMSAWLSPKLRA